MKLDASGNFVWAKKIGGVSNDAGKGIVIDGSGNVYSTGFFMGLNKVLGFHIEIVI